MVHPFSFLRNNNYCLPKISKKVRKKNKEITQKKKMSKVKSMKCGK